MLTVGADPSCAPLTVGTTACNATPYQYPLTAHPSNCITMICGACGGKNGNHQAWCNMPSIAPWAPYAGPLPAAPPFQWPSPTISNDTIERIARRAAELVVELLDKREAKSQDEWEAFEAAEREEIRQREARYEESCRLDRESRAIAIAREDRDP